MSKISKAYGMAKSDAHFIGLYNESSTDKMPFSTFPCKAEKASVAGLYYGYLIGIGDLDSLGEINKPSMSFGDMMKKVLSI